MTSRLFVYGLLISSYYSHAFSPMPRPSLNSQQKAYMRLRSSAEATSETTPSSSRTGNESRGLVSTLKNVIHSASIRRTPQPIMVVRSQL